MSSFVSEIAKSKDQLEGDQKGKYCVYFDEGSYWGHFKMPFQDLDAPADSIQMKLLKYLSKGCWDIPKN